MNKNDPDNYREMSAPFASPEEADAALRAFADEFYALRNKYRIADILAVVNVSIRYEDGRVGEVVTRSYYGNEHKAESLAAWSMGYEQSERQARIAKVLRDATRAVTRDQR